MARTWSVPHRESFAGSTAHGVRSHAPLKALLHASSHEVRRGPLLLLSALLTLGLPTEILAVCVGAFVGGLVTLIVRMKDRGSGPDDGAVI